MAIAQPQASLPRAIRCYFEPVAANSAEAVAKRVAVDGVVIYVDRRIAGHEAIGEWATNEVIGGSYNIIKVEPSGRKVSLLLTFAPHGKGSFRARYEFEVDEDKIVKADLPYASTIQRRQTEAAD